MAESWPYLEIVVPPFLDEPVTAVLFDCGCCGTAADSVGDGVDAAVPVLTAWFPDRSARDEAARRLRRLTPEGGTATPPTIRAGEQQREDWLSRWREGQKPFPVGRRLLVLPCGDDPVAPEHAHREILRITPGLAFGTGHHETTRFCLEQLEAVAGPERDFLDVGTGSGILAVAAVLLGCRRVVGTDIDPGAVRVARETLDVHGLSGRVELLVTGEPERAGLSAFPLVAANILGATLIDMAPALAGPLLAPGGTLLLAGILAGAEEQLVVAAYQGLGLDCLVRRRDGEWAGLVLEKPHG